MRRIDGNDAEEKDGLHTYGCGYVESDAAYNEQYIGVLVGQLGNLERINCSSHV